MSNNPSLEREEEASNGPLDALKSLEVKLEKFANETVSSASDNDKKEAKKIITNQEEILEALASFFMLLFEYSEPQQVEAAKQCGSYLVQLLLHKDAFDTGNERSNVSIQSLLCISALCNYENARCVLVETTDILKICVTALTRPQLCGSDRNQAEKVSLRDKVLSCLSTLVRGYIQKAIDAGLVAPAIDLLGNEDCVTDQLGSAVIILCLMEPEKGQLVSGRILLSGVVPMLFATLDKPVPTNATQTERVVYRHLNTVGLRCVACVLRHQQLARDLARQFFDSPSGERALKSVIEHTRDTSKVSSWLYAAEILVWLSTVPSCHGILARFGAKQALQAVVRQADPHDKWVSLVNQAVSVKVWPALWKTESSMFQAEIHGFLALWMHRYASGGLETSADAFSVRQRLCSKEWLAFCTTLLESPDAATRHHAFAVLSSLRGDGFVLEEPTAEPNDQKNDVETKLYSHLLGSIGLDESEEKNVVDVLKEARLPLHILLRPGINMDQVNNVIMSAEDKLAIGTRLAVVDALAILRQQHAEARKLVQETCHQQKTKAAQLPQNDSSNAASRSEKSRETVQVGDQKVERPECFISYCWAQKRKAKEVKAYLEQHGIKCWMDEHQMEGGSMLFQEIDDGISACDVVVSCLSPDYTQSVNCTREVLLATDRKKATIPVLLESLEHWPPRGNMGPILAGKLYIRMDEDSSDASQKKDDDTQVSPGMRQLVQSVLQLLNTKSK